MGLGLKVVQVVGYQNSGKTTLIADLIQTLSDLGKRVVTIKHHGHNEEKDNRNIKDTDIHLNAGSRLTSLVTSDHVTLSIPMLGVNSLQDLINLYEKIIPYDTLLVEGFKQESYPKIVIIRDIRDKVLLDTVDHVVMVIAWRDVEQIQRESKVPVFDMKNRDKYIKALVDRIGASK